MLIGPTASEEGARARSAGRSWPSRASSSLSRRSRSAGCRSTWRSCGPAHVDLRPFVLVEPRHERRAGRADARGAPRGLARRQLLAGRRQQGHLGAALLMLSRVAESLYWTGRYIERAEDTSRLLHVNFHGLLDADLPDRGRAWRDLIRLVGHDDVFREHFSDYSAPAVTEFLLWHPDEPGRRHHLRRARQGERPRRSRADLERDVGAPEPPAPASSPQPAARPCSPRRTTSSSAIREGSHALPGRDEGDAAARARRTSSSSSEPTSSAPTRPPGCSRRRCPACAPTSRDRDERAADEPAQVLRRVRGVPADGEATSSAPTASSRSCCSSGACRGRSASASS